MRFAHMADVHLGAWRDSSMKALTVGSFRLAVNQCIAKKVDFVLIAGDLFNTAVPSIEQLQHCVILLKRLKNAGIGVYVVPGSHDFNAGGRSIIDVLQEADLLVNVMKGEVEDGKLTLRFTKDPKTGALLTGIGGRRGTLERKEYSALDKEPLESEPGTKIFLFHSPIAELVDGDMVMMQLMSASQLPKGFNYYAGGHVHIIQQKEIDGRLLAYPGPLFPASFPELWKLENGGFYIWDDGNVEFVPVVQRKVIKLDIKADGKSAAEVNDLLKSPEKGLKGSIFMLQVSGTLSSGKVSEIDFKGFFSELYSKGVYFAMRSTTRLTTKDLQAIEFDHSDAEELEEKMISEMVAESGLFSKSDKEIVRGLIKALSDEQLDGEKKYEYEARMKKMADEIMEIR